jgi:hypothetical protein
MSQMVAAQCYACNDTVTADYKHCDSECALVGVLRAELDAARRERDGWQRDAERFSRNEQFYHGLIQQIGQPFGVRARTSDDGSVQEDVLALRVPELVEDLRRRGEALASAAEDARQQIEYLHGRFKKTGSGEAVLSHLNDALAAWRD